MSRPTSARTRGRTSPKSCTTGRTATRRPTSPTLHSPPSGSRRARPRRRTHPSPQMHPLNAPIDRGGRMFELSRSTTHRRGFLGRIAASAAAFGLGGLVAPFDAAARPTRAATGASANPEFEAWQNKISGKHKMVYDVPEPNDGFAFAWARGFRHTTNETYGTTDADNTVVIVLRHSGIPYAMESAMSAKYKFGDAFKITDPATKGPAIGHPLIHLKPDHVPIR